MNPEKIFTAKFDHEKLEVYRFELEFVGWLAPLFEEADASLKRRTHEVCDQLNRASLSMLLNTAEGNGKRQRQVRAKFFDDARGSATECAACLDALVAKKIVSGERVGEGKILLLKIVSMLSGLVNLLTDRAMFSGKTPPNILLKAKNFGDDDGKEDEDES